MLPRGRPPGPGTAEEKAAIRREKVRLNVKAFRERKKSALAAVSQSPSSTRCSPLDSDRPVLSQEENCINKVLESQSSSDDESCGKVVSSTRDEVESSMVLSSKTSQFSQSAFWSTPNNSHVFAGAFLSFFRTSFLPAKVCLPAEVQGESMLVTQCSPWITTAYNMAADQKGSALKSGLLAIGLILNGLGNSDNNLQVASLQMQRQAICQLRNELEPVMLQRQRARARAGVIEPYLSCLAVTMFELIQTGFSPAIIKHVKALNSLIEMMYADPHIDRVRTDLIMEDFGMFEMMFCLKFGFDSTLRHTRRRLGLKKFKDGDAERTQSNASVYGDILDIVEDLPYLIIKVKDAQQQQNSADSCKRLQYVIQELNKIESDLNAWRSDFEGRYGSLMIKETFVNEQSGRDEIRYRLRSYEHGATSLNALGFQLYALDGIIEATVTLAQTSQHHGVVSETAKDDSTLPLDSTIVVDIPGNVTSPKSTIAWVDNTKALLHERIRAQRLKLRVLIMHLLQLIEEFAKVASNITAQSLMVCPCGKIRDVIQREHKRLHQGLHQMSAEEYSEAIRTNTELREIVEIGAAFDSVQSQLLQSDFGSLHGG